jgi:hypothetical protein
MLKKTQQPNKKYPMITYKREEIKINMDNTLLIGPKRKYKIEKFRNFRPDNIN